MSIIVFLAVFSIIVTIHEFGHYYVAKKSGVLVREFALGMGPKIVAFKRGETTFTIRALPLGGFVRMAGYDDTNDQIVEGQRLFIQLDNNRVVTILDTQDVPTTTEGLFIEVVSCDMTNAMQLHARVVDTDSSEVFTISKKAIVIEKNGTMVQVAPLETHLESASVWKRIAIYAAGPICNFLLSIFVFIVLAFANGGVNSNSNTVNIVENSPSALVGLKDGTKITAINDVAVNTFEDMTKQLALLKEKSTPIVVTTQENGSTKTYTVTLQDGKLGIYPIKENSLLGNIAYGFTQTFSVIKQVWQALSSMVTKGLNASGVGGPLAIIQASGQVAQAGLINVLVFLAMLSANLGAINLLIIPGLDGGKILLGLIEVVRKKPLSKDKEIVVTMIGVGLLLLLTVVVTFNDIVRLFNK